jgi:KDO2-lipid IV(A) lauroyltransferase
MASHARVLSSRNIVPAVLRLSGVVPGGALLGLRPALAMGLYACLPLRRQVESRMAAALGEQAVPPGAARAYFEHLSDLIAFSLLTWRRGFAGAGLREQFFEDESGAIMRDAVAAGRGALMASAHLVCHEMGAGWINLHAPVTTIVRHSADPVHEERKVAWYGKMGVEIVYRPKRGENTEVRELAATVSALRQNRVLAITPDLLQEPGRGVPVTLFGRTAHLPGGPAYLARRTGAAFVPSFFWKDGGRYRLICEEPIEVERKGDTESAVQAGMQEWCRRFERFVRRHPDMWLFWLDKRWGRWLAEAPAAGSAA